ncbi:MAG TPA: DNA-formamidopyrimidine glycosylase family protein, partial [Pyrinomonadaceae bacterium]|nr:DNA-formamidopyrimidine glycosylase family protein [Pyrinomonadaceae bacterium]
MPELPEVEHVVRALRRAVLGRQISATEIRLPKLISPTSPSAFNRKLKGGRITSVGRRGKFILIKIDSGYVLAVHLRMTGKFQVLSPDDPLPPHAHVVFYLDDERRLVFRDQRQFGVMRLVAGSRLSKTKGISELAPEPFSDDFSVAYLREILGRSQRSL